jgi:hypothetical protein
MKSFLTPAFVWGLEENRFWCFCMRAKQELANLFAAAKADFFSARPIVSQFTAADPFLAHLSFCLSHCCGV